MRPDVAIDVRRTRRMSVGTLAYLDKLLSALPQVAPELRIAAVGRGENFGIAENVALPLELARIHPRLVHYPTLFAPVIRAQPYVATVHDLIHLRHPEFFGRATAVFYATLGGTIARGARLLCMGDERTVDDCERYLRVPRERCRVVPLGFDPALLGATSIARGERPYFFYAGNHRPHKNLETLYRAWNALAEPIDLVLTGADEPAVRAAYARPGAVIRYLGDVLPAALWARYRGALAYVQPSLAEGFGIPMLEALAVGTPVIASHEAVPTLVRPYAQTFPARNASALTDVLRMTARDPGASRARASEGALAVRAYTWDRFAAATAAVYHEVLDA